MTAVTPRPEIDAAIADLVDHKDDWPAVAVRDRRAILTELIKDFSRVARRWAEAGAEAKGLDPSEARAAEEWLAGPYFVLRNLQLLDRALADIERHGRPKIPGAVTVRDGRTVAPVFPQRLYDRIFYGGVSAEVWMQPGITPADLEARQAAAYRDQTPGRGAVCLVLGGGNVSSIGPMDLLYKLFVDDQVVLYKTHPVNAYLGPLLERGFTSLVDWGVLRIVDGDAETGAYLCQHPHIDTIHITGSDKTVEAIVFGPGAEGERRKAARRPRNAKPITSELGNVSPVIVVPGPWSDGDIAYQGENLAATLVNNAGFNCNATRVIVTHAGWGKRPALLDTVRQNLAAVPPRTAYYPGAEERHRAFVAAHPEAERLGEPEDGALPWTLIPGVETGDRDDICFTTEAFCGLFAETALVTGNGAVDAAAFLDRAVDFANDDLWGTLNATILIHPKTAADPAVAEALERAIAGLRYGTVSINNWAAIGYGLVIAPWGAFPGHDIYDIQSGVGVVHNTLMLDGVEKTVIRSPWRMKPKPMWFPSHETALDVARRLTAFEADPSPARLPGILWAALRG